MQNRDIETNKSVRFAVELTQELELDSRGVIEEPVMLTVGGPKDLEIEIITNIDITTTIFQHHIEAYNVVASTSDTEAKRMLGYVHTKQSKRNYNERITNVEDVTHLTSGDYVEDSKEVDWINSEYSRGDAE